MGRKSVSLALVAVLVALLVLAIPRLACAAAPAGEPPSGFCEFLSQGWNEAGIGAGLAALVAIILEYLPGFGDWPAKKKQLVYLAICLGIGFGSWGAALLAGCVGLPDWWTVLVAAWQAFRNGVVAFGAGTVVHALHAALKG
ncbi:MAG: hypothetical protein WC869_10585 [Phycisphaerae bacterium]|jgi:hypothetical protein